MSESESPQTPETPSASLSPAPSSPETVSEPAANPPTASVQETAVPQRVQMSQELSSDVEVIRGGSGSVDQSE